MTHNISGLKIGKFNGVSVSIIQVKKIFKIE